MFCTLYVVKSGHEGLYWYLTAQTESVPFRLAARVCSLTNSYCKKKV